VSELVFLKLGGSLITEKSKPATLRADVLQRAVEEIAAARKAQPSLRILLGHGSGSFGHVPAKKHGTRDGVHTPEQWAGFVEVWRQAAALNRAVMDALAAADLPAIAVPPSTSASAADGAVQQWDLTPITAALDAGLMPVVYGDVVFDSQRGGTILSTEDLFVHLAAQLRPSRISLAGDEAGVLTSYPGGQVVPLITPASYANLAALPGASAATDVTGGMASKVEAMLQIVQAVPACTIRIFSGLEAGNIAAALAGEDVGTAIRAE
jgi:isopentenyl phosphate kinase